jgi:uncharacterized protein DUF6582
MSLSTRPGAVVRKQDPQLAAGTVATVRAEPSGLLPNPPSGANIPRRGEGMSTAEENRLADTEFAFPTERKEPLTDARHVRNAIARFDQVEGVSDAERDRAWKRILAAAERHGVEVSAASWRDLAKGGKDRKRQ